jgi:hypothetical protein
MTTLYSDAFYCDLCGEAMSFPQSCFVCRRNACVHCATYADEHSRRDDLLAFEKLCLNCKAGADSHIQRLHAIRQQATEAEQHALRIWRDARRGLPRCTPVVNNWTTG